MFRTVSECQRSSENGEGDRLEHGRERDRGGDEDGGDPAELDFAAKEEAEDNEVGGDDGLDDGSRSVDGSAGDGCVGSPGVTVIIIDDSNPVGRSGERTTFARKTFSDTAGFPFAVIEALRASMLGIYAIKIGLSFERRIGLVLVLLRVSSVILVSAAELLSEEL